MTDFSINLQAGRRVRFGLLVYRAAGRAPLVMRNRYGTRTIGLGVRLPRQRVLSILWRGA